MAQSQVIPNIQRVRCLWQKPLSIEKCAVDRLKINNVNGRLIANKSGVSPGNTSLARAITCKINIRDIFAPCVRAAKHIAFVSGRSKLDNTSVVAAQPKFEIRSQCEARLNECNAAA